MTTKPPSQPVDDEEVDESLLELLDDDEEDEPQKIAVGDIRYMLRFLAPFLGAHLRSFAIIAVVLVVDTAFNISFPLMQRWVIDEGLVAHNWDVVAKTIGFLCFAAVAVFGLGIILDWQTSRVAASLIADIRGKLFNRLHTLPLNYFQKNETGAILSRFSGDTVAVEHALVASTHELLVPLIEVVYATIIMFMFNFWMGLIGFMVLPLSLFAPKFFAKRAFALGYDKRQQEARLMGAVQETATAQPVLRAYDLAPRSRARFRGLGASWFTTAYRFNFAGALVERSATTGVYIIHLAVFALGALWVWQGKITVGTLVAFEAMFLYMGEALTWLTQVVPTLAQAAGSMRHLDEMLLAKTETPDGADAVELPRLSRDIEFRNVGFGYPGGRFRIENFNLTIPKGGTYAIVGGSGSGKSTILGLFLRLNEPDTGMVLIDGRDARAATKSSLRAQCAIVFQDSFLFNTSIGENIAMGREGATQEQIEAAARDAEVHEFIAGLPDGYATRVGERGGRLSGGQRQRVAIARALVRDPAILLLDEATSALDAETESALLATLARIGKERTVISVTHRLASVVDADMVIIMEKGKLREFGRHDDLLAKNGVYARLWKRQSKAPA
jgi:ATP-binding cassette subfamily B protein